MHKPFLRSNLLCFIAQHSNVSTTAKSLLPDTFGNVSGRICPDVLNAFLGVPTLHLQGWKKQARKFSFHLKILSNLKPDALILKQICIHNLSVFQCAALQSVQGNTSHKKKNGYFRALPYLAPRCQTQTGKTQIEIWIYKWQCQVGWKFHRHVLFLLS